MARTFNAGIWGGIGDAVARDDILRRERNQKTLGGLLDAAKFIEKTNANRRLRDDWQKYFDDRKAAAEADAAEAEQAEETVEPVTIEEVSPIMSIFLDKQIDPKNIDTSIWAGNGLGGESVGYDPSKVANGYTPALTPEDYAFIQGFNPKTASPEDIVMAQRIVGTDDDGIWGKNSRAAYKKFMGGV